MFRARDWIPFILCSFKLFADRTSRFTKNSIQSKWLSVGMSTFSLCFDIYRFARESILFYRSADNFSINVCSIRDEFFHEKPLNRSAHFKLPLNQTTNKFKRLQFKSTWAFNGNSSHVQLAVRRKDIYFHFKRTSIIHHTTFIHSTLFHAFHFE